MISFRGAVHGALSVTVGRAGSSTADGGAVFIAGTVAGDAAFGGGPLFTTASPSDII